MITVSLLPKFRPIGATGNNLQNPALDSTPGSAELRIAPANFAPGTTNGLVDGTNPRTISNVVASGPNADITDPTYSAWLYVFGQFVDHDLDLERIGGAPINITIPPGDPVFANGSMIPMNRAITDPQTGTAVNDVAGFLDLSQLYGSDTATAASLRNADGTLKITDGGYLPIVNDTFVSGDVRVAENPEISAVTTLFMREHNHWVGQLKAQHPDWSGDQLYNMAKAITTAEYENIIYTEYLPALVGNAVGQYQGYDPKVNAMVSQEFSTAAFRVGHSQISNTQAGIDNSGNVLYSQTLGQAFNDTAAQVIANGVDGLLRNLSSDPSQATDVYVVDGLRNELLAPPDTIDLIAIDIQRGRDLGLGTLNETRQALGLAPYTSFAKLTSDPTVQANLQAVYGSIDKVDLFMGGLAENHVPDAVVGPTFQAIIAAQFTALRAGDQFFWQNEAFDPATARMIGSTTLSDIIRRDTETPAMQRDAFIATQRHSSDVAAEDPNAPQLVIGVDTAGATIAGGPADDTIVAGLGADQLLTGDGGKDVFMFIGSGHVDTITDYSPGVDRLDFTQLPSGLGIHDLMLKTAADGSAVVHFNGNSITLAGVRPDQLSISDYLFNDHAATATVV